ncbi:nucleoside/nucleotide kinase family protein [Fulvivirga lutea]|uniref:Uridine kinase n=1 Tax=Fulvivirga lutea TaxID=2810512 RepID=A0A975A1E0_9BACT|nr:hypothetical protein [Fulvivirga lutea]QSE98140.1 hypothetical protein JR347_03390 [Fulvivirga lutea]
MIIGIGGVSRSGKTTLAKLLQDQLGEKNVKIISQDDFALDKAELPTFHGMTDWEHPNGINFDSLRKTVLQESKKYPYLITEGFLIYHDDELRSLIDFKIFIDINEATFLNRKMKDDRWGKTPIIYVSHIWDSYLKYGKISDQGIDLKLDGTKPFDGTIIISEIIKSE